MTQKKQVLCDLQVLFSDIQLSNSRAIGEAKGRAIGEAIGEERLSTLLNRLIMDGRSAEIQSVVTNAETRKRLYKEYGILSE